MFELLNESNPAVGRAYNYEMSTTAIFPTVQRVMRPYIYLYGVAVTLLVVLPLFTNKCWTAQADRSSHIITGSEANKWG